MGEHEVYERAVAKDLDGLDRQPVTKTLKELLIERPHLSVTSIRRRDAFCELATGLRYGVDRVMQWSEEYHAWSCRPETGIYQQIIIFVPREADE